MAKDNTMLFGLGALGLLLVLGGKKKDQVAPAEDASAPSTSKKTSLPQGKAKSQHQPGVADKAYIEPGADALAHMDDAELQEAQTRLTDAIRSDQEQQAALLETPQSDERDDSLKLLSAEIASEQQHLADLTKIIAVRTSAEKMLNKLPDASRSASPAQRAAANKAENDFDKRRAAIAKQIREIDRQVKAKSDLIAKNIALITATGSYTPSPQGASELKAQNTVLYADITALNKKRDTLSRQGAPATSAEVQQRAARSSDSPRGDS